MPFVLRRPLVTGRPPGAALLAGLLGSAVNIPVLFLHADVPEVGYLWVRRGRVLYSIQLGRPGRIKVAVNVGGAVIPTIVSVYLLVRSAS